jgi:hypothetical protein
MTKDQILQFIEDKTKNFKVKFIKSDGTERIMNFTRNTDLIDDLNMTPKGTGIINNPDILKVVELCEDGKTQWRSFRFDSVISIEEYNP